MKSRGEVGDSGMRHTQAVHLLRGYIVYIPSRRCRTPTSWSLSTYKVRSSGLLAAQGVVY